MAGERGCVGAAARRGRRCRGAALWQQDAVEAAAPLPLRPAAGGAARLDQRTSASTRCRPPPLPPPATAAQRTSNSESQAPRITKCHSKMFSCRAQGPGQAGGVFWAARRQGFGGWAHCQAVRGALQAPHRTSIASASRLGSSSFSISRSSCRILFTAGERMFHWPDMLMVQGAGPWGAQRRRGHKDCRKAKRRGPGRRSCVCGCR